MQNDYRLKLLSHNEIFPTREEAVDYINDNFKGEALWAEPAVFYYGTEKEPKLLLAFGASNNPKKPHVYIMDNEKLRELIDSASDTAAKNENTIDSLSDRLVNVIQSVGLTLDENKVKNQVSYDPNKKDELISDAETVASAVAIISEYVQKNFKKNSLSVKDSGTISFDFDSNENGSSLTSNVKLSEEGADDDLNFNDNIIGLKQDGLFASVNIEYDADKNQLIFTTSGNKNGKFVTDANKKIIDFGKHTVYTSDNNGHNVEVKIDSDAHTISGDLKISDDEDNILTAKDGKLFVDGRAKNIKYEGITVAKKLHSLDSDIQSVNDKIDNIDLGTLADGVESDSAKVSFEKERNGGYQVKTDIKLSSDNTIVISNGGLSANIEITGDSTANKLHVKIGDKEKDIALPGVSIIDSIKYDSKNHNIEIVYKNGDESITIPLNDLIAEFKFINNDSHTVHFDTVPATDGSTEVYGNVVLSDETDNMLTAKNGGLYVSSDTVDKKVQEAIDASDSSVSELKETVNTLSEKVQSNTDHITAEASRAKAAETENANGVNTNAKSIEDEVSRAKNRENEIGTIAETNRSDISNIKTDIATHKVSIDANAVFIKQVSSDLAKEVTRATEVEKDLNDNLNTVKTSVSDEVKRATNVETEHKSLIDANIAAINTLNGTSDTPGSVNAAVNHMKDDFNTSIASETDRAKTAEVNLGTRIDNLVSSAKSDDDAVLNTAKTYADNVGNTTLNESKTFATQKDEENLAAAKVYADDKISSEKERATNAEKVNSDAITALQSKDVEIENELGKKISTVEIVKSTASDLQYILKVDGKDVGEINIPKDNFLENVTYDNGNKALIFTFQTTTGTSNATVDISDLVDTYVNGNGLNLTENVFSIKLNPSTESYLTLDENGVAIKGIDEALNKKANVNDVYTKSEVDSSFKEETERAKAAEAINSDKIGQLQTKQTDTENRLSTVETGLETVNGNEATAGSIKKALADAEKYADDKVSTLTNTVNEKANSIDVYTKADADAKFLTEHQSLDDYATNKDLNAEKNRAVIAEQRNATNIDAIQPKVDSNEKAIEKLQDKVVSQQLIPDSTHSIELFKSTETNGTNLSANVKLDSNTEGNIIRITGNGLLATVTLSYDKATNSLKFNNGSGEQSMQLAGATLINGLSYDSANKEIVLSYTKSDGIIDSFRVKVEDLLHTVTVYNETDKSPIRLELVRDANNVDTIKGDISLLESATNAITKGGGALYVSKRAADMFGNYQGKTDQNLQEILDDFTKQINKIDDLETNVNSLQTDVSQNKVDIAAAKGNIETLKARVSSNEEKIAKNTGAIDALSSQMTELSGKVTDSTARFNDLKTTVDSYSDRISALETDNKDIKTRLTSLSETVDTLKKDFEDYKTKTDGRLTNIEEIVDKLIDFGEFGNNAKK